MRRLGYRIGIATILLAGSAPAAEPASRPANPIASAALDARVRQVARDLPWLDVGTLMYDRPSFAGGPSARVAADLMGSLPPVQPIYAPARGLVVTTRPATIRGSTTAATRFLVPPPADVGSAQFPLTPDLVLPLLDDADANVRALAVVLLARTNRLDVLPAIARLADDAAPTFPRPADRVGMSMKQGDRYWLGELAWPTEPQTVGDVVRQTIRFYFSQSPTLTTRLPDDADGLVRVVRAALRDRDAEASVWAFKVAMARATFGQTPFPPERAAAREQIIGTAFSLPGTRRFFVLLAIDFDAHRSSRYSLDALESAAAEVPRSDRLAVIGGAVPMNDPDLPAGFGAPFFLDRAERFLLPADADKLLALERMRQGKADVPIEMRPSAFAIAAARLQPDRAADILNAAMDRYAGRFDGEQRAAIAAEIVATNGAAGRERAVEWFFAEQPQRGSYGFGREQLLWRVRQRRPDLVVGLAAQIVRDPRLTTLGPQSTAQLIDVAQAKLGRELVADDERRAAAGIDESQRDRKLTSLPQWHASLRDTVDEWAGPASTTAPSGGPR